MRDLTLLQSPKTLCLHLPPPRPPKLRTKATGQDSASNLPWRCCVPLEPASQISKLQFSPLSRCDPLPKGQILMKLGFPVAGGGGWGGGGGFRAERGLTLRQPYMQMDIQLVSIFSTTDSVRRNMSLGFLAAEASMRSTSSSFMMLV